MRSFLSILPFVIPAFAATGVLLPLYVYPGTSASAWAPVTSAIAAYPSVQWQIIINPASGPGTTTYPDANWITGIKQLNSYSNVKTLGYVHTSTGTRPISQVEADINGYVNWGGYTGGNIAMAGIFFDEVSTYYQLNTQYPAAKAGNETYYQTVANYAYAHVPSSTTPVVFNPGSLGPAEFFDYCDTMVEFEDVYTNYQGTTTLNGITNSGGDLTQTAILIHDTPSTITTTTLNGLVHTMKTKSVQFAYFTTDCCWNVITTSLFGAFVSAINSA